MTAEQVTQAMVVNWQDVPGKLSHGGGESHGLLQHIGRADALHPVLHTLGFLNRSRIPAGAHHEPHLHDDHEEVFFIVGGKGAVLLGEERRPVHEGDAVYIPVGTVHGLINDSDDWLDFVAIGGVAQP